MAPLQTTEVNVGGIPRRAADGSEVIEPMSAALCPYCSKMFPVVGENGRPTPPPAECSRCGSPMDLDLVGSFADQKALDEHNPAIALLGARTRNMLRTEDEASYPKPPRKAAQ